MSYNNSTGLASIQLMQSIMDTSDLLKIIHLGEELLSNPISFADVSFNNNFISKDCPKVLDNTQQYYEESLKQLNINKDFLSKIEEANDDTPFIIYLLNDIKILVSKVYYCKKHLGYILVPWFKTPLENLDYNIIKLIGNACAIAYLLKENNMDSVTAVHEEDNILEHLLSEKYKTINDFNTFNRGNSFYKYGQFSVACLSTDIINLKKIKNDLYSLSKNIGFGYWTKIQNNRLIALFGYNDGNSIYEIASDIEKIYVGQKVLIGISDPFSHLLATKHHYKNVEMTVQYAENNASYKQLFFYDNYKFNMFLSDVNPYVVNTKEYISYKVLDILGYDQEYNTEYTATLKTYLSCSLSPQLTADTLFIHRNTVIYRINRIKELFNIKFSDADQNFQLYFSFQLLMTRGWGRES